MRLGADIDAKDSVRAHMHDAPRCGNLDAVLTSVRRPGRLHS